EHVRQTLVEVENEDEDASAELEEVRKAQRRVGPPASAVERSAADFLTTGRPPAPGSSLIDVLLRAEAPSDAPTGVRAEREATRALVRCIGAPKNGIAALERAIAAAVRIGWPEELLVRLEVQRGPLLGLAALH